MNFLKQILSANSPISSKRFNSLYSLILLTAVIIADVFLNKDVNNVIYYILLSIILGSSAMTLTQNKTTTNEKEIL